MSQSPSIVPADWDIYLELDDVGGRLGRRGGLGNSGQFCATSAT
jgi:hypothetical protein